MLQKIGFWSVFALVTGSQIGTGVLILPASLAAFGIFSLVGWIVSSCGAIILALVFAILCAKFPKTGGPHVYIKNSFGHSAAFFTGWTYWVISWVSTTAVVISAIKYLSPLIGIDDNFVHLILEITLLLIIMWVNLKGIGVAGRAEFVLAILKFIPLVLVPVAALYHFDISNFALVPQNANLTIPQILGKVALLTFWGFIGLESATTQAGSVINPSKTVPKAVVAGTLCVAILYLVNSIGILGLVPRADLMNSNAPYVDAARIIFGGHWHLLISLIASIICIGTLNAWVLTSGQIALGLAEDGFLPSFFAKKNKVGAPFISIILSSGGIIPLLIITANENLSEQITRIIDFSVIAFLFVYLACSVALLKLLFARSVKSSIYQWLIAIGSIAFCLWIVCRTALDTILVGSFFVLSGVPIYFFWYKKTTKLLKPLME